jgi:hypothetical protein
MHELVPNAQTGFLESVSPANYTFDSARKVKFLELANAAIEQGHYPAIHKICDAVGITHRSFDIHVKQDEKFGEAWDEIKRRINSSFTTDLSKKANSKNGIVATLAILKYNESGSWLDSRKVQFSSESSNMQRILADIPVIEAEIVDQKAQENSGNGK